MCPTSLVSFLETNHYGVGCSKQWRDAKLFKYYESLLVLLVRHRKNILMRFSMIYSVDYLIDTLIPHCHSQDTMLLEKVSVNFYTLF